MQSTLHSSLFPSPVLELGRLRTNMLVGLVEAEVKYMYSLLAPLPFGARELSFEGYLRRALLHLRSQFGSRVWHKKA
eukprot:1217823-Amphidinium_carterae.1